MDPQPPTAPVQLTRAEVARGDVRLVRDGLLGRGATALVFKCVWPKRFGRHVQLAAKVLKDGHTPSLVELNSFAYEASVLSAVQPPHPHVVRLHGYCLEPPTVCLILELLPTSLHARLYDAAPPDSATATLRLLSPPTTASLWSRISLLGRAIARQAGGGSGGASSSGSSSGRGDPKLKPGLDCEAPAAAAAGPPPGARLSIAEVLRIGADIAAGLMHMHGEPEACDDTDGGGGGGAKAAGSGDDDDDDDDDTTIIAPPLDSEAGTVLARKVVHRDLKPSNVLLDAAGRAKLSDFGLARSYERTTLLTSMEAGGTLPYMAPELLVTDDRTGAQLFQATTAADMYAFGMILCEMLVGHAPWHDVSSDVLVARVLAGERPWLPGDGEPTQGRAAPPPELRALIRACWAQRPHKRPTAAAAHGAMLRLIRAHDGL